MPLNAEINKVDWLKQVNMTSTLSLTILILLTDNK